MTPGGAEEGRASHERGREGAELGRGAAERDREGAEVGRAGAEDAREVAEGHRREAFEMPVWVPQTKRSALTAALCLVIAVSIPMSVVAFLLADQRSADRAQAARTAARIATASELRQCEDKKQDRVDNARAWTQAERTWAASARDLRFSPVLRQRAARTALIYGESAASLRTRLVECEPYVREGRKIIDRAALLDAEGKL